jgi:hypothetical protein
MNFSRNFLCFRIGWYGIDSDVLDTRLVDGDSDSQVLVVLHSVAKTRGTVSMKNKQIFICLLCYKLLSLNL